MFWKLKPTPEPEPTLAERERIALSILEDSKNELAACQAAYRQMQRECRVIVSCLGTIVHAELLDGTGREALEHRVRDLVQRQTRAEATFHEALRQWSGLVIARKEIDF